MDTEIKRKWVEALRSGEYEQGQRTLRTKDGRYCCMGVCAEVVGGGHWEEGGYYKGDDGSILHAGYLGGSTCERIGLPQEKVYVLADMNDHEGKTFAEIADFIEQNL